MIETVLSLGVKGSELIISQLEKIQAEKEKFERPSKLSILTGQNQTPQTNTTQPQAQIITNQNQGKPQIQDQPVRTQPITPTKQDQTAIKGNNFLKSILDALKKQKDAMSKGIESRKQFKEKVSEAKEERKEKQAFNEAVNATPVKDYFETVTGAVSNGMQALASLTSGGALRAATGALRAIPGIGEYAEAAGTAIVNSTQAFRDNVRQAASLNFDTSESRSRIQSIMEGSKGENFTGRVDIDINSQRQLAEAIGNKYGIVQKPLQDAIKELYKDQGGKAVDINQAGQLAQGNFAALGTDKGFFLQKIADQLGGLPPSFRQSIQTSLLSMIPKSEQRTETSRGARSAVTAFTNQDRQRAAEIAKPEAVQQALQINALLYTIDKSLNNGFSKMIEKLNSLQKTIENPSQTSSGSLSPVSQFMNALRPSVGKPF